MNAWFLRTNLIFQFRANVYDFETYMNSLWQRKKEKKDELHFFTKSQKYLKPKKYVKIKFLSDAFTTESLQKCVVVNVPIKKHMVRARGEPIIQKQSNSSIHCFESVANISILMEKLVGETLVNYD